MKITMLGPAKMKIATRACAETQRRKREFSLLNTTRRGFAAVTTASRRRAVRTEPA